MQINSKSIIGRTEHVTLEVSEQNKEKRIQNTKSKKGFLNKMPVSQDKMPKINNRFFLKKKKRFICWAEKMSHQLEALVFLPKLNNAAHNHL